MGEGGFEKKGLQEKSRRADTGPLLAAKDTKIALAMPVTTVSRKRHQDSVGYAFYDRIGRDYSRECK